MIGKRNVSLRELRTFCVAAELASFRETAEALFVTPSAVSHQVKSLEEALEVQLFERLTRSNSPRRVMRCTPMCARSSLSSMP